MDLLLQGFVLGAVGGIVPGAVLTILLVSALQGGLYLGLRTFFWAMLSEIAVAGALLLLATQIPLNERLFMGMGLVGGFVLVYFAFKVFTLKSVGIPEHERTVFTPLRILILSATNAPLYIFWISICFPLIWQLAASWGLSAAAVSYFVAFELGWGISTFMMLMLFIFSRSVLMDERIMRKVFVALSIILAGFGIKMFITSVQLFQ
ncbi:MAG: Uncharacterized protein G01um10148_466 [Parcubacteria group bacterium Gr01-1014_8]|nr:MAG: Uncharacterized protein G01um10148_466 [Parcubacteria group bacterium Gr01-1014_8]